MMRIREGNSALKNTTFFFLCLPIIKLWNRLLQVDTAVIS